MTTALWRLSAACTAARRERLGVTCWSVQVVPDEFASGESSAVLTLNVVDAVGVAGIERSDWDRSLVRIVLRAAGETFQAAGADRCEGGDRCGLVTGSN